MQDLKKQEEKKDVSNNSWEDVRNDVESYVAENDLELYCDDLGKMRLSNWAVI